MNKNFTTKISKEEAKRQQVFTTQHEFLKLGKILAREELKKEKEEIKKLELIKKLYTNLDIPKEKSYSYLINLEDSNWHILFNKMNIYFNGILTEYSKKENIDSFKKYIISYYQFIDNKNNELSLIDKENKDLKEQIEQMNLDTECFIDDADIAEQKNIKLKKRVLKLREKCIYKNKLIFNFKIINFILFCPFFYQYFNYFLNLCFFIFKIPFYYFSSIFILLEFYFNYDSIIKIIFINSLSHLFIFLIFKFLYDKKFKLKNKSYLLKSKNN